MNDILVIGSILNPNGTRVYKLNLSYVYLVEISFLNSIIKYVMSIWNPFLFMFWHLVQSYNQENHNIGEVLVTSYFRWNNRFRKYLQGAR